MRIGAEEMAIDGPGVAQTVRLGGVGELQRIEGSGIAQPRSTGLRLGKGGLRADIISCSCSATAARM
jgi:hypothetical protein